MAGAAWETKKPRSIQQKEAARAWFEELRDRICASFETLETELPATAPLVTFARAASSARPGSATTFGTEGGGGIMRLMTAACSRRSASTPRPSSASSRPSSASRCPGAEEHPRFWASRHLADRAPAESQRAGRAHEHAHGRDVAMVVRRRRRPDPRARPPPHAGGRRHARLPRGHACRLRSRTPSPTTRSYKTWCDEYFYLPHRKEMRGIGGIFYDS